MKAALSVVDIVREKLRKCQNIVHIKCNDKIEFVERNKSPFSDAITKVDTNMEI